jgi:hypothetical protein
LTLKGRGASFEHVAKPPRCGPSPNEPAKKSRLITVIKYAVSATPRPSTGVTVCHSWSCGTLKDPVHLHSPSPIPHFSAPQLFALLDMVPIQIISSHRLIIGYEISWKTQANALENSRQIFQTDQEHLQADDLDQLPFCTSSPKPATDHKIV